MKTLYIECKAGVAGDMLMAALWDICEKQQQFTEKMNGLMEGLHVRLDKKLCGGIECAAAHVTIHGVSEESGGHSRQHDEHHEGEHAHHHHQHTSLGHIRDIIDGLDVSWRVKENAAKIYDMIAAAESRAHGTEAEQVHFHEVGALDAVADIVGVCYLMELIAPEHVVVSPINLGNGTVKTAHGILPVPAPATAELVRGIPSYLSDTDMELCTPTGAALVRFFGNEFAKTPDMVIEKTGYGAGTRDTGGLNCVRCFLGESSEKDRTSEAAELSANVDDMTAEQLGYACGRLMEEGALDVFFTPVYMKKNRPAYMITCLCLPEKQAKFARLMLRYTSTFGVRARRCDRYCMDGSFFQRRTKYGTICVKKGNGYGIEKEKPEFEDVARLADEHKGAPSEIIK